MEIQTDGSLTVTHEHQHRLLRKPSSSTTRIRDHHFHLLLWCSCLQFAIFQSGLRVFLLEPFAARVFVYSSAFPTVKRTIMGCCDALSAGHPLSNDSEKRLDFSGKQEAMAWPC